MAVYRLSSRLVYTVSNRDRLVRQSERLGDDPYALLARHVSLILLVNTSLSAREKQTYIIVENRSSTLNKTRAEKVTARVMMK